MCGALSAVARSRLLFIVSCFSCLMETFKQDVLLLTFKQVLVPAVSLLTFATGRGHSGCCVPASNFDVPRLAGSSPQCYAHRKSAFQHARHKLAAVFAGACHFSAAKRLLSKLKKKLYLFCSTVR